MINHWTFRCKDVSHLISRSMDENLGFWTRIGIRFHLMICHLCRRYQRQLLIIRKAISKVGPEIDGPAGDITPLPDHAKNKIKTHLADLENKSRK